MIRFAKVMALLLAVVLAAVGLSRLVGLNPFSSQQILTELGMATGFYVSFRALRDKAGIVGYLLGNLPWLVVGGFGAVLIINAPSSGFFVAGAACIAVTYVGIAGMFRARKAHAVDRTSPSTTTGGGGI